MFSPAAAFGIVLGAILLGGRRSQQGAAPFVPSSPAPDPLAQWAGPVVASADLATQTVDAVKPPEAYYGGEQASYTPPPQASYTPPPAADYGATQASYTPPPAYDYSASQTQAFDPYSGAPEGVKPPGATAQYESAPSYDDARARAARELALHLASRARSQWDRAAIRAWQSALGVRVDGLIGPETRGAMARFGQYVSSDKHE